MSSRRFSTIYSLYGAKLDVDELLSKGHPTSPYRVWRRGEQGSVVKNKTSGIQIDITQGRSIALLHRAISRFLMDESLFLRRAARMTNTGVWSLLSTALFVWEAGPVTLHLPKDLMALAAKNGVDWQVTGYPTAKEASK